MYNSAEIAERIKRTCKETGKPVNKMLSSCGLGKNTVAKISSGTDILTLNFAKIADYLNCSVDYLLGRENKISAPPNNDSAPDNVSFLNNDDLVTIRIAARNGGDIVEQTFTREQAEFIKLLVDRSPDSTDPRI